MSSGFHPIPERTINHHSIYHVAQASQAKHGSFVDRGANGGLGASDVRILPDPPENALSVELTVMSSRALMWSCKFVCVIEIIIPFSHLHDLPSK